MFVTNGNRRPKPVLKLTCEKTPSVLSDIQRRLDDRGAYHSLDVLVEETLRTFRKQHASKHLIAFLGNEIKDKSCIKMVEVSLYALPKRSVQKVEDRYRKNPVVHLKSDFVFDDELVGMKNEITILVDRDGGYHAYEVDQQAAEDLEERQDLMLRMGRFPFAMVGGKLHVALPLTSKNTRKTYVTKRKEAMAPRITLKTAQSRSKWRIDAQDATSDPLKPRKAAITADYDIESLPDGRYRGVRDGVYLWLIKSSVKVGSIVIEQILLLAHDDANAEEVSLNELPTVIY